MQNAMHAAHKHNAWSDLFRLFCITHTYIYAYIVIGVASDDLFNGMPLPIKSPRRPRLLTTDGAVVKCPRLSTATSKESLWLNSQPAHLSSGLLEPVSLRNSMPGKWLDPGDMSHVDSSAREHRCASGQNELNHIP